MTSFKSFKQKLFRLQPNNFEDTALQVFRYQANHNVVYKEYLDNLNIKVNNVNSCLEIPFMPISFFKHRQIKTEQWDEEIVFKSSGTTGQVRSEHYIKDLSFYTDNTQQIFQYVYGDPSQYNFLALLPSYLERQDSSLIYMVDELIKNGKASSGYYLNNLDDMVSKINLLQKRGEKIFIIGVTFALLDLAENYNLNLEESIVMETGGMKGRRKEVIRSELHQILCKAFNVSKIHSEYGMTELLSQAYAIKEGIFYPPNWMRAYSRNINDPFEIKFQQIGGLNIIDLANIDSCSFIETQDMGRVYEDGGFEVIGRIDNSEIRGCNLLVTNM
ncbi:MAG: acyl transferase [Fulvivirga sp.]